MRRIGSVGKSTILAEKRQWETVRDSGGWGGGIFALAKGGGEELRATRIYRETFA